MRFERLDYKTISIEGKRIDLPKRIKQLEAWSNKIAVRIGSKKTDPEYSQDFIGGNVYILGVEGVLWQFDKKTISSIWKKDENTLCMYDGQTDIWVDINKLEVVRMIWNPWGLDEPEKY